MISQKSRLQCQPRNRVTLVSQPVPRVQRLLNIGNTCFVNSALQALASFDLFFDYLSMTRENPDKCKVSSTLLEDLTALKEPLNDYGIRAKLNSVPVVEEYFIESMEQQDSSEFITFLMEWVDTEVRDTLKILQKPDLFVSRKAVSERLGETENYLLTKEGGYHVCTRKRSPVKPSKKDVEVANSPPDNASTYGKAFAKDLEISGKVNLNLHDDLRYRTLDTPTNHPNPFSGTIKSCLVCPNGHISSTYVNFLHLSVPINRTIESCFEDYTKIEEVEWNCESCVQEEKNGNASTIFSKFAKKQLSIAHPPKILCIHFQRLVHRNTSRGFGAKKLETPVRYGLKFNISPYCTGPLSGEKPTKIDYDLRAIIVHIGGSAGGHYVTYKRYSTNSWVYISDDEYRVASVEEALNVPAFMLFYSMSK